MRRDQRLMTGVIWTFVTAFDLLIFLTVFGAITLTQPIRPGFLWMLLSFLATSLITGVESNLGAIIGAITGLEGGLAPALFNKETTLDETRG